MDTTGTMRHSNSAQMYQHSGWKGAFFDKNLPNHTGIIYCGWWFKLDRWVSGYSCKLSRISDQRNPGGVSFRGRPMASTISWVYRIWELRLAAKRDFADGVELF